LEWSRTPWAVWQTPVAPNNPERQGFWHILARGYVLQLVARASLPLWRRGLVCDQNYEIVTEGKTEHDFIRAIICWLTFLGGVGFFFGPISIGASPFTLLQTVLAFDKSFWAFYAGSSCSYHGDVSPRCSGRSAE